MSQLSRLKFSSYIRSFRLEMMTLFEAIKYQFFATIWLPLLAVFRYMITGSSL
jgi:hypothetical protein